MDSNNMEDELEMVSETNVSEADKQGPVDHIYGLVTESSPASSGSCGMASSVSAIRGVSWLFSTHNGFPLANKFGLFNE